MKRLIIVGAGFAGFQAAKKLRHSKDLQITLIDQKNYHLFQPLLYQIATAGLSPADISVSLRSYFNDSPNMDVILAQVDKFDFTQQEVEFRGQTLVYDYLILATGAKTNFFGNNQWAKHLYELKNVEDAIKIRNRLLGIVEDKEFKKERDLSIAVIGGGPTGVELAGSMGEFFKFRTRDEFHYFDPKKTQITLLEGNEQILSNFSSNLAQKAETCLNKLGVKVLKNTFVENVEKNTLHFKSQTHQYDMIIWTAGVCAQDIESKPHLSDKKTGKIPVLKDLSLQGFSNVFVLGDQSSVKEKQLPAVAPVAIQQGHTAATNILNDLKNKKRIEFEYQDKGSLAVIGRRFAVAKIYGLEFSGFIAWFIWCFAHIIPLVSFRNKLIVFFEFLWSYISYSKGVRLITNMREDKSSSQKAKKEDNESPTKTPQV